MLLLFNALLSSPAGQWLRRHWLALALLAGIGLGLFDAWQRHCERQAERVRYGALRTQLLDSVARSAEARARQGRDQQDSVLARRARRQAAAAATLSHQNDALERRYRAGRVQLPAY